MSKHIEKAFINIVALYGKIAINTVIALFTTRIALKYLGITDFGLFSLIGGVVMMLSFLNGSLMQSTQRFLSIAIGQGDEGDRTKVVFNTGIMLHILMSLVLFIVFFGAQPFLFDGFLNIPADRMGVAVQTYQIVVFTTIITFFTIPYNAAINAREDMWFFSITDIIVSLLKLVAAVALIYLPYNDGSLLVIYTMLIMISALTNLFVVMWWCKRYPECKISKKNLWNKEQIKAQISFTGWNSIVSLATIGRNQGVAIVMNLFFGTVTNAAYGVANQINSLAAMFTSSISTVFAPQIVQSFGANDNERMVRIAIFSSKITLLLSMIICLPILLEAHQILKIWLGEVPQYSSIFCKLIVAIFIVMQFYPGLVRTLYAQGDIKWYQVSVSIALIIPVIVGYLVFKMYNLEPQIILYLMLAGQIATLLITIFFAKIKVGLNAWKFLFSSILKPLLVFIGCYCFISCFTGYLEQGVLRLALTCFASVFFLTPLLYILLFTKTEKEQITNIIRLLKNRPNEKVN